MLSGSSPNAPASTKRPICAFWVLTQTVSLPSTQQAAVARPSMGTGASRWLTIARSTTTSQPSNAAPSAGLPFVTGTFDPASGNSSVCPASPSAGFTTAGSGS